MKKSLSFLFCCLVTFALLAGCCCGVGAPESLVPAAGSTGNPPLIPHDVDADAGGAVCLECHRTGEGGAPKYPEWHATLSDCLQCHVPQAEVAPFAPSY